ncbi:MAG TPA: HD domain-containing phosphohydrolase, partial [Acidobacteriota bacterium]|nr:HD domain-containing phosphohydrolase [Acidobacteriota bacterium]
CVLLLTLVLKLLYPFHTDEARTMFKHQDPLSELNKNLSLNKKLKVIHSVIKKRFDFVDRISVALYDRNSKILKTFLASSGRDYPLELYDTELEKAPSLMEIYRTGTPRLINDLSVFQHGEHEHTKRILDQGYRASYTTAMFFGETLGGFVFFNSYQTDCFDETAIDTLDVFSHLISEMVAHELGNIKTMLSALKAVYEMLHLQDAETGLHLERMSKFCRIIAKELALRGKYDFNDEDVERIQLFSGVRDIGKIMKSHNLKGLQLTNSMIDKLGFGSLEGIDVLRNIAMYHNERIDGTGPSGLKGGEIPIEARIVAVADIFDAMTSHAWSNEEAFAMLRRLSQSDVDQDCVEALAKNQSEIEQIQVSFMEIDTDTKESN